MIRIRLNDVPFEADIREIFQAFYPGEQFLYGNEESEHLTVDLFGYRCEDVYRFEVSFIKDDEMCSFSSGIADSRFDTKSDLKRQLYRCISGHEGRLLPWGTLTGIRPTKLALQGYDFEKEFLTGKEKADLCLKTAQKEKDILERADLKNGWSLYTGIPFCPTRCAYCSFTSYPIALWREKKALYLDALFKEIDAVFRMMRDTDRKLKTVYIGGGTPTSLDPNDLDRLLSHIGKYIEEAPLEYTVEAGRPDSITVEKLDVLKKYGITRISINPQTMNQQTLERIGRRHSTQDVIDTFMMARKTGFDNINMDIIAGLPGESTEDFVHTLDEIGMLKPDAITVHCLAIKRAAGLNTDPEKYYDDCEGHVRRKSVEEMIRLSRLRCESMGLLPYYLYRQKNMEGNQENVGYAAKNKEGIYNVLIMEEAQPIIGCGAGSSSKIPMEYGVRRFENVKDPQVYIDRIEKVIDKKKEVELWL